MYRARERQKRHGQSTKQGIANQSRLKSRASKCRSGTKQTNYWQRSVGRPGKVKTRTIIRKMKCKDTGSGWGQLALIEAITKVLDESGQSRQKQGHGKAMARRNAKQAKQSRLGTG